MPPAPVFKQPRCSAPRRLTRASSSWNIAPRFATMGPVELREALRAVSKAKDPEIGRAFAQAIVNNPVLVSVQVSVFRTTFQNYPPEIFEQTLLPALHQAEAEAENQRRQLGSLAEKAVAQGRAEEGRKLFEESGHGSCIACHQIGEVGRSIGPNLSHIGADPPGDRHPGVDRYSRARHDCPRLRSARPSNAWAARSLIRDQSEPHRGRPACWSISAVRSTTSGTSRSPSDTQLPTSLMPVGCGQDADGAGVAQSGGIFAEPEVGGGLSWARRSVRLG